MHTLSLESISPYIRYVNDVTFAGPYYSEKRILFDHEFIFPISGVAYHVYNGITYKLTPGSLFYLSPNIANQLYVKSGDNFRAHCVHFDWIPYHNSYDFTAEQFYIRLNYSEEEQFRRKELMMRPSHEIVGSIISPYMEFLDHAILLGYFNKLYQNYLDLTLISSIKNKAIFLEIIASLIVSKEEQLTNSKSNTYHHERIIKQSIIHMRKHYKEDLSTSYYAELYGITPKYYGTIFKSIAGASFTNYILDIRLQEAKQLLLHSNKSISTISEEVGIHDFYYFTKLFHKNIGFTPSTYRKNYAIIPSRFINEIL